MENNKVITRISEILDEKVILFAKYEEVTDLLVKFDVDTAEDLVNKREKISKSIMKLNQETKEICDNSPIGEEIREAMYSKVDWSNCKLEYQPIFKKGQEVAAIISRLRRKDSTIVESVNKAKETITERIKKQNKGVMGKSAKYYRSTQPMGSEKFKLLDSKM